MSQQENSEICPQCGRGRMVWTGFANVENELNPPFDVTEREQFRQRDVFSFRGRSVSRQERVNVKEEVQAVLRGQRMIMIARGNTGRTI